MSESPAPFTLRLANLMSQADKSCERLRSRRFRRLTIERDDLLAKLTGLRKIRGKK